MDDDIIFYRSKESRFENESDEQLPILHNRRRALRKSIDHATWEGGDLFLAWIPMYGGFEYYDATRGDLKSVKGFFKEMRKTYSCYEVLEGMVYFYEKHFEFTVNTLLLTNSTDEFLEKYTDWSVHDVPDYISRYEKSIRTHELKGLTRYEFDLYVESVELEHPQSKHQKFQYILRLNDLNKRKRYVGGDSAGPFAFIPLLEEKTSRMSHVTEESPIDFGTLTFDGNTLVERVAFLKELGIIDYLMNNPKGVLNANSLSLVLSAFMNEKRTSIQSYVNHVVNSETGEIFDPKNNPLKDNTIDSVRKKLHQIGYLNRIKRF